MKLFRGNLFNRKTLDAAVKAAPPALSPDQAAALAEWSDNIGFWAAKLNESQLEQSFNRLVMQGLLGYRESAPTAPGTMQVKQQVGPGVVDLALGRFGDGPAQVMAPVELKGPKTQYDRIMPGRAKTPVQQAWDYANDAPGARWVLVSNMISMRLYAYGHGRTAYEEFDLQNLADADELARLLLLVHADKLLGHATHDLLSRSAAEDRDITNQLYRDYRDLRVALLQFIADQRPHLDTPTRVAAVQKLLDRLTFIAVAEDTVLLERDTLKAAVLRDDPYDPQPKWEIVRRLFRAVDLGNPRLRIPPYNGGLFAEDATLDALDLPDHLVGDFLKLTAYDYRSEVSVTVLGHLFEQTVADIERDLLAPGGPAPAASKRKLGGIVYTPDLVTRFIVERTLGAAIAGIEAELLAVHADGVDADGRIVWRGPEADYWRAFVARLHALTVLDPACGSGHFLVAAFDALAAASARARDRLRELDPTGFTETDVLANRHIITCCLHGVDLNAESTEITRLSLWLKTAKRDQPLDSLLANIRVGNAVVSDASVHDRAFDWEAFRAERAPQGFDVVLGNPPYVRMEHLKPIKPHLQSRFAVASDRADLYAYFFELGVSLLRPGGRLGYISSSTFFRTGSGAPLRGWLSDNADIEEVIDFGDAQVFEGVTTYPAILTMRRRAPNTAATGDLRFLNLRDVPTDLGKAFDAGAQPMPRERLTRAGWRFEGDRLAELRARMAAGRKTLAEVYGAPLYGIKTGLNDAFVLSRAQRDALVAADPASADLLKPFLVGEDLRRWHVDGADRWLIYTPKNRVDIAAYPAVREHLSPFRERLEARATKQNWWELQQAQAAYEPAFLGTKTFYNRFTNRPQFSFVPEPIYSNDAPYFIPSADCLLATVLNTRACWLHPMTAATALQGGYVQLHGQYMEDIPLPDFASDARARLTALGTECAEASTERLALVKSVHARMSDIAPAVAHDAAFRAWPTLDLPGLRVLLRKRHKAEIALSERDEWDRYLAGKRAEHAALTACIAAAEAEINDRVNHAFGLTPDDVKLIEETLAGQY